MKITECEKVAVFQAMFSLDTFENRFKQQSRCVFLKKACQMVTAVLSKLGAGEGNWHIINLFGKS